MRSRHATPCHVCSKVQRRLYLLAFGIVAVCAVAVSCGKKDESALGSAVPESTDTNAAIPAVRREFANLPGKWKRRELGYVLEIKRVDPGGTIEAAYFIPRPIQIARAAAIYKGGATRVFMELRDEKLQDSTYSLVYNPENDQLLGLVLSGRLEGERQSHVRPDEVSRTRQDGRHRSQHPQREVHPRRVWAALSCWPTWARCAAPPRIVEFDINQRPMDIAEALARPEPEDHRARHLHLECGARDRGRRHPQARAAGPHCHPGRAGGQLRGRDPAHRATGRLRHHRRGGFEVRRGLRATARGRSGPPPRSFPPGCPSSPQLALPYELYDEQDVAHRIIYVEASRGCPFSCEFCLSSLDIPVRQAPLPALLDAPAAAARPGREAAQVR